MSPFVCAGPTSISSTSRPPTSSVEPPVEGPRRRRQRDAVEVELAEEVAEQVADVAGRGGEAGEHRRATSPISSAQAVEAMISAPATSSLP